MKVIFLSVHSGSHCCCWPCSKQFYCWPPFALWSLDFPSAALSFSPPIAVSFFLRHQPFVSSFPHSTVDVTQNVWEGKSAVAKIVLHNMPWHQQHKHNLGQENAEGGCGKWGVFSGETPCWLLHFRLQRFTLQLSSILPGECLKNNGPADWNSLTRCMCSEKPLPLFRAVWRGGRGGGDATGARQLQNATTLLPFGLSQTFHSIFPPPQVKMGKIELTQWRLADGIHFIFDLTSFSSVFPIFFLCPPLCVAIVCEFVAIWFSIIE